MKLHLPKMLLTAVLAVVGIVSSVQADETTYAYSGTIYTWAGTTSEYHAGPFWTTTLSNGTFTLSENKGSAWGASSQGTNTIRFSSDSTASITSAGIEFGNFSVGGFIVESDTKMDKLFTATGSSDNVAGAESGRTINIGKEDAYSLSTIEKDFEVKSCGSTITLVGNQRWDIASADTETETPGATFKINAKAGEETGGTVTNNGNIIQNGGTVDFNAATISGTGAYTVGSGTLQNATFASGAAIDVSNGATLKNVTLSNGFCVADSTELEIGVTQTITKTLDFTSSNVTVGTLGGLRVNGAILSGGTSAYENSVLTITSSVYTADADDTVSAIGEVDNILLNNGTTLGIDDDIDATLVVRSEDSVTLELNSTSSNALSASAFSAAGATINVTKNAASTASELSLGSASHSIGTLVIGDGVTVSSTYNKGDEADGKGFIKDNLTINGGGTFKHSGNDLSPFGQGTGKLGSITMGGGTKTASILLTNRSAIHGTTLTLQGNTLIGSATAEGAVTDAKESPDNNRDKKAILDFVGNNEVSVSGTGNVVNAALRLRNGETTFNVAKTTDATGETTITGELALNGNIFKASGTSGKLIKKGEGKLIIGSASSDIATFNVESGAVEIKGGTHTVSTLDMSCQGNIGTGTVTLKKNAAEGKQVVLTAGTLWLRNAATLNIEEGATLKLDSNGIVNIKGTAGSETVKTSVSTDSTDGIQYGVGNENFTISNGQFTLTGNKGDGHTVVNNKLRNVALVNEATGVLIVRAADGARDVASIHAKSGNVNLTNMTGDETLSTLQIENGMKVGAHTGYTGIGDSTTDFATLNVTEALTLGTGSVVDGHLKLVSGTVSLAGVSTDSTQVDSLAQIVGKLTLAQGDTPSLTLSSTMMQAISGLNDGESIYILKAGDVDWGNSAIALIDDDATGTTQTGVDASLYFKGLTADSYNLSYDAIKGLVNITKIDVTTPNVPEPTTATLSLLALAGLAARRRRK